MIYTSILSGNPITLTKPSLHYKSIHIFHYQIPKVTSSPKATKRSRKPNTHLMNLITTTPNQVLLKNKNKKKKKRGNEKITDSSQLGSQQMLGLCGFGYWVQGFRCFSWLALNFHMAHNLNLHPSTLQLVQNSANLPMVAKPLYGALSDAFYIGGAHRIPYISIGGLLAHLFFRFPFSVNVLSWGALALIPGAGEVLPTLLSFVLLGNLGASITEVAKDALVAEYAQKHKIGGLQSYAFMALATGGILGNLFGGFFLTRTEQPKIMFLLFTLLLSFQLAISFATREDSLGLSQPSDQNGVRKSISEDISKRFSNFVTAVSEESIYRPLIWIVASITIVPILSGTTFCYQIQFLNINPSVIGMSKVIGQLMLLSAAVLYDRYWKNVSTRKLVGMVQIVYATSLLLDLVLVKQLNLKLGIPNEIYVLCFSSLAETVAQFKLLPFVVLFANLCPPGCEGSLTSFLASSLCLSSIVSGLLGVALASLTGITSSDYSNLPVGILLQFLAALVPLGWISFVPTSESIAEKEGKMGRSKRSRRNRRVGRVAIGFLYAYRREREYEI
ncbi:hypothetical protein HHK36_022464 [Tetracentron sinense]|uniref:Uncharacterized protein n=1 Tax=Tetracentron sinense TaxID=13715 RepID=A0A834YUS3_TETSI|nr:hypothetical protein HHK36_022464 [Tetracentron sinense]